MVYSKSKVVVEVDTRILRDFDKDVKKRGTTRTWMINSLMKDYVLTKEAESNFFPETIKDAPTRKTAKIRNAQA